MLLSQLSLVLRVLNFTINKERNSFWYKFWYKLYTLIANNFIVKNGRKKETKLESTITRSVLYSLVHKMAV